MARTHRTSVLTSEERARVAALREQLKSKPSPDELIASGGYDAPITMGDHFDIAALLAEMKAVRIERKMSLRDCAESAGIDYAALSRLENGVAMNPTVHTLARCARALGKKIQLKLVDDQRDATAVSAMAGNLSPSHTFSFTMTSSASLVPSMQFVSSSRANALCGVR